MRTIYLKVEIDWEDYDDVCDELIIEDAFGHYPVKDGVNIEIVDSTINQD